MRMAGVLVGRISAGWIYAGGGSIALVEFTELDVSHVQFDSGVPIGWRQNITSNHLGTQRRRESRDSNRLARRTGSGIGFLRAGIMGIPRSRESERSLAWIAGMVLAGCGDRQLRPGGGTDGPPRNAGERAHVQRLYDGAR